MKKPNQMQKKDPRKNHEKTKIKEKLKKTAAKTTRKANAKVGGYIQINLKSLAQRLLKTYEENSITSVRIKLINLFEAIKHNKIDPSQLKNKEVCETLFRGLHKEIKEMVARKEIPLERALNTEYDLFFSGNEENYLKEKIHLLQEKERKMDELMDLVNSLRNSVKIVISRAKKENLEKGAQLIIKELENQKIPPLAREGFRFVFEKHTKKDPILKKALENMVDARNKIHSLLMNPETWLLKEPPKHNKIKEQNKW
jgi:hypothetical protein